MHSKNYVLRKAKMTNNLGLREYKPGSTAVVPE
jgi:hypothetical protein